MSIPFTCCSDCGVTIEQKNGKIMGQIIDKKKEKFLCPECKKTLVFMFRKHAVTNKEKFRNFVEEMAIRTNIAVAQLFHVAFKCS